MLRVANVSAGYAGFQALFDVSLDVNAGESVAVIGPNGAGKTTLLRLISKLIEPTRGEVFFDDQTLTRVPAHAVVERGIAHVPENRRLFPRLSARRRAHRAERHRGGAARGAGNPEGISRAVSDVFDIFLLEAVLNGLLLGGLLALLSLGLNLIFGVIDVVWICYAELIMCGMYAVYYLHVQYHWPLLAAMAAAVVIVAVLGVILHQFVIRPVLGAEPINQLLVTGGVLFFLQAAATLTFGIEFRNLGVTLPSIRLGEMSFSAARLVAFCVALAGMLGMYLFLSRSYLGTAIRAISQDRAIMPLMGVSPARIFVLASALGGALAGLGACLLVLQYDVHPAIGLSFGPITFLICVMGGLGSMAGGFIAAFVFAQFISVGGFFFHLEWGYVFAFAFFIAMMFWRPQGILGRR